MDLSLTKTGLPKPV
uniref:Uncharacterized protein n=1 Tax=Arundo donax TaxID=35708 RepID=A0A0A9GXG2_ARUDO